MKHSLRTKLSLTIALIILLTVASISFLSNILIEKEFTNYLTVQQEKRTQEITDSLSRQYDMDTKTWDADFVHTIGMYALYDGYIVKVYDLQNQTIWDAETCDMSLCTAVMDDISHRMNTKYPQMNGEFMSKTISITKDGKVIGTAEVSYFGPYFLSADDFQFLNALNTVLIGIGVFALIFSVIVGLILAKRLSSPILHTVTVTKQISEGDYGVRITDVSNTRELNDLIVAVNHLADSLGKQESLRKQLTADVAHELRTPLTSIGTHIEAMIEGVWEPTNERLKSCHDEILRIGKIIQDLENLAKVESDNLKLEKTQIHLHQLSEKAVANFAAEIDKKKLNVLIEGESSDTYADPNRVSQVIINLVSNAVKYTPEHGIIKIFISEDKQFVRLSVCDNGIGIPEDELPYVFGRFYRADKSRNRMIGGSGIGLAIVKSIVTAHGGMVEAESHLNEGSCFVIKLPKNKME